MNRVVLGTVQFGLDYGVANTHGRISPEQGGSILAAAREAGIRTLDTAVLYGDSEATLGVLGMAGWQVISKLPEMPSSVATPAEWVRAELTASLARLRLDKLHGLLLHRPAQLLGPGGEALYHALLAEREQGRVGKVGISVYGPEELDVLPRSMRFDIVQAPWNVLDQRMMRSGWADRLQAAGCEFHARSVFLQGLLLMPREARPARFVRWQTVFDAWDGWLAVHGLSPLAACLRHALAAPGIARIVVGVDSTAQLAQIVAAASAAGPAEPLPAAMATADPALLNPALWSTA